jgi:hypothetical protein
MNKQPSFTQTLMRLVKKTLCDMANEDCISPDASGALYRAANEIGRRHLELVTRARQAVEWQKQLEQQEGSAHVR